MRSARLEARSWKHEVEERAKSRKGRSRKVASAELKARSRKVKSAEVKREVGRLKARSWKREVVSAQVLKARSWKREVGSPGMQTLKLARTRKQEASAQDALEAWVRNARGFGRGRPSGCLRLASSLSGGAFTHVGNPPERLRLRSRPAVWVFEASPPPSRAVRWCRGWLYALRMKSVRGASARDALEAWVRNACDLCRRRPSG